jgi:predicted aspartyl protease
MPKTWSVYRLIAMSAALIATPTLAQQRQSASSSLSFVRGVVSVDPQVQGQWIDLEEGYGGLIVIPIMLNGQRLMAMLDTGAPTIMVDADWAIRHGITYHAYEKVGSMGGGRSVQIGIAPMDSLRIAGVHQTGGAMEIGDLKPLSSTAGGPIDALVGADFLSVYAITLDFDNHRIRFQPSGSPRPAGSVVPIEPRDNGQRFITQLMTGTRLLSPVMIDTGDSASLTITQDAWTKSDIPLRMTNIASIGLSGDVFLSDIGRLDGVRFGDQRFDKVPVMFERIPLDRGDEARIGMKLLDRFNVFLDMGQRVMILSPRLVPPAPDPITMSGIQGTWSNAGLQIVHVMKGSPAEAVGLRPGERICAIDGTRITSDERSPLRKWSLGPAGEVVSLTMCDGRTLPITLREFY